MAYINMNQSPKKNKIPVVVAVVGIAILIGILFICFNKKNMSPGASQCSTAKTSSKKLLFNSDQKAEIQQILFDTIREKSQLFIGAVNEGMQSQQDKVRQDIQKAATTHSKRLLDASIPLGNPQANVRLVAFIDPLCPHCQVFETMALSILQQRQDVVFHLIPIAILGEDSAIVSKAVIAAAKLSPQKFNLFIKKLVEKYSKLNKAKLGSLVKEAGLDAKKFEKELNSKEVHEKLTSNTALAEELKLPGVPAIFAIQGNGEFVVVPPTDAKDFGKIIDNLKAAKPLMEGFNPVKENADEA
jgi:protein-disulfide isomerase